MKNDVLCYQVGEDGVFPDLSTADGGFVHIMFGDKSYRVHLSAKVFGERGLLGEARSSNLHSWFGDIEIMADRSEQQREITTGADNFPEALRNLIVEAGPVEEEEFALFCRLAAKYAPALQVFRR